MSPPEGLVKGRNQLARRSIGGRRSACELFEMSERRPTHVMPKLSGAPLPVAIAGLDPVKPAHDESVVTTLRKKPRSPP
jgi:hypothetical protein